MTSSSEISRSDDDEAALRELVAQPKNHEELAQETWE
jgi:hypothetical protein